MKNSSLRPILRLSILVLLVAVALPGFAEVPPVPSDVEAPPADAEKTESGIASKVLQAGTGDVHPGPKDSVTVHYSGWTTDGKMFDSSLRRGKQSTFGLDRVIAGWTEGLQLMVVGEKRRFWIPEKLAYQGRPGKPAGMLVFDVELFDIASAPKAPADVATVPSDAEVTASELASKVLQAGTGSEHPKPTARVTVHYSGWTTDGALFDSSRTRGEPATFGLDRVIAGWTEGLQLMVVGEKRRFWIPEKLAYQGRAGKPAGMLVFDVELLDVANPPEVPADVAAPPADAEVAKSGLASKVLQAGTGSRHPKASSRVTVHYSGWTTDGEMFDSSVIRGEPATFGLNQVIRGWTQGVQLMVVGEKRRFWIPEKLAYKGVRNRPQGMLVFDIELLDIE